MYTRFFGLHRLPFEASPDPGFLFDGPAHREAIASIEYAVATGMGFIMLTGEVGLGKTTVIRAFLDRFDRDRLLPIYVFHPLLSFDELLELVSDELGLALPEGIGNFNRLRAIQRELIRLFDQRRQVILVIDEAQRLPEDTLENLRLLTNLETNDAKLLQIVLIGQPELEVILAKPHLRQLEQRIVLKARLESLSPEDSVRYLHHRLALAGAADPFEVLTPGAINAIVEIGEGVPRRMNILTNRTLIDAFGADEKPVTAARVRRVAAGAVRAPARQRRAWRLLMAGTAVVLCFAAGIVAVRRSGSAADVEVKAAELLQRVQGQVQAASLAQQASPAPMAHDEALAPAGASANPSSDKAAAKIADLAPATGSDPARPPGQGAQDVQPQPAAASKLVRVAAIAPNAEPPPPFPGLPTAKRVPDPPDPTTHDTFYTVVPGDTLWKICLRVYGPDIAPSMVARVMSRNRIVSDVRLLWGTTIILPASKTG